MTSSDVDVFSLQTTFPFSKRTARGRARLDRCVLGRVRKEPLNAHDKYSFDHPPLTSAADWEQLRDQCLANLETLAAQIRLFPADQLGETFVDEKYGTYLRNFMGLIEHTHYHLGQIVMIRKMINEKALG